MIDNTVLSDEGKLGLGIYTLPEAARLLEITPRRVKGWSDGYRHWRGPEVRPSPPVIERSAPDGGLITFRELIELFFVREFVIAGVALPKVREAHSLLRKEWETPFPFAHGRLFTDGKVLLIRAGDEYREVASHQGVFAFAENFFKDIDFDRHELAIRWWPLGRGSLAVVDPQRAFGAPIEVRSGVRTEVLFQAFVAENRDFKAVADWFEVAVDAVRDAVTFEERCLKAA